MRRTWIVVFSMIFLLLALSACGGGVEPESASIEPTLAQEAEIVAEDMPEEVVVEEAAPTSPPAAVAVDETDSAEMAAEESAEVVEDASEVVADGAEDAVMSEDVVEEVSEDAVEVAVEAPAIVDPTEYGLISQTGRPQFLNSYASW